MSDSVNPFDKLVTDVQDARSVTRDYDARLAATRRAIGEGWQGGFNNLIRDAMTKLGAIGVIFDQGDMIISNNALMGMRYPVTAFGRSGHLKFFASKPDEVEISIFDGDTAKVEVDIEGAFPRDQFVSAVAGVIRHVAK